MKKRHGFLQTKTRGVLAAQSQRLCAFAVMLIAAIFTFTLAGCDLDSGGGSGDGGGTSSPAIKGKLTINNIPAEYNGKYVYAQANCTASPSSITSLVPVKSWSDLEANVYIYTLTKIENGTAAVPLYTISSTTGKQVPYEGNDFIFAAGMIVIKEENTISLIDLPTGDTPKRYLANGTQFSRGSLTVDWETLPTSPPISD